MNSRPGLDVLICPSSAISLPEQLQLRQVTVRILCSHMGPQCQLYCEVLSVASPKTLPLLGLASLCLSLLGSDYPLPGPGHLCMLHLY